MLHRLGRMEWSMSYSTVLYPQLCCSPNNSRRRSQQGHLAGVQMAVAVSSHISQSSLSGRIRPESARLSSRPTHRSAFVPFKKASNEAALEETKSGFVDYDIGQHAVTTQISGFGKNDIPRRYRLRVEADRFQKDWSVSEVAQKVLKLRHWEDIHGLLNRWIGRFSRKNFPLLMKVRTDSYFLVVAEVGDGALKFLT